MELLGIGLGLLVALLWASSDTIATVAARHIGSFKTTFLSQTAGLLALCSCGVIASVLLHLPFPPMMVGISMLIGIFTGVCAALGYFYFYRALETGPIALVCPPTSTSPIFTLLLSVLLLRQHLVLWQIGAVIISMVGILLASIRPDEIRSLLRTPGSSFLSEGVRWAIIAALAFAAMDVGIGASSHLAGWFLPVLWTRIFSICALTLISYWQRHQRRKWFHMAPTAPLAPEASTPSTMSNRTTRTQSSALAVGNQDGKAPVDPDATVILRSSGKQDPCDSFDPDATVILHPARRFSTRASVSRGSAALRSVEASHEETGMLQPFRPASRMLTLTDDVNQQRRMELSHADTMPLAPQPALKASTSSSTEKILSLSLPCLEQLSRLRTPLTSPVGMGLLLAIIAGVIENTAALGFSLDTQLATTGIASAITSGYSLMVILFGIVVYHERLSRNQVVGITLFMIGLVFLAFIQ